MMRILRSSAALSILVLGGTALASPATDIFKEATDLLTKHYYGTATNAAELIGKHRTLLESACAKETDACAAGTGIKQVAELLKEFDARVQIQPPTTPAAASSDKAPIFGWVAWPNAAVGEMYVYDLASNGPAMRAGLMRGDRIVAVNGVKLEPQQTQAALSEAFNKLLPPMPSQEPAQVTVLRNDGKAISKLDLRIGRGTDYDVGGLPFLYRPAGAPDGVLVLRILNFVEPAAAQRVHDLVRQAQAQGATALIVDLMGSTRGDFAVINASAGAFIGNHEYTFRTRDSKFESGFKDGVARNYPGQDMTVKVENPVVWTGKLALMVQEGDSASTELFTQLLRNAKKGTTLGESTYGMYLQVVPEWLKLSDGSTLITPAYRPHAADGTPFPERIVPDVAVNFDELEHATSGWNVVMERAWKELGY